LFDTRYDLLSGDITAHYDCVALVHLRGVDEFLEAAFGAVDICCEKEAKGRHGKHPTTACAWFGFK
jgi:hypothetical protein